MSCCFFITQVNDVITTTYSSTVEAGNVTAACAFRYTYDKGGNITEKSVYPFTTGTPGTATDTIAYTYDSTWKDKMTSFDGYTLDYDALGNPWDYTHDRYLMWEGRELRGLDIDDGYVEYRYNQEGLRCRKTFTDYATELDDVYDYFWTDDCRLLGYTVDPAGSNADPYSVLVLYNSDNEPIGFTVGEDTYYYVKNIQGDVLCVTDDAGTPIVHYTYDAWGAMTISPASQNVSSQTVAEVAFLNPVTYRGYFYDHELGFYYLQSRYYDPETGRFISIDNTCDTKIGILGTNMYLYCCNNPVMLVDNSGREATLSPTQVVAHLIGIMGALAVIGDYLPLDQRANFLAYFSNLDVGIGELYSALINYINYVLVEKDKGNGRVREVAQAGIEGMYDATAGLMASSIIEHILITPGSTTLTVPIMICVAVGGFASGALKEMFSS